MCIRDRAYLEVSRDAAARLGLTMDDVTQALYSAFGQRQVATLFTQSNQYRVVLEVDRRLAASPEALERINLRTADGQPIPLSALATVSERAVPLAVNHLSQFPAVNFSFNLPPGGSLGAAIAAIEAARQDIAMPASVEPVSYTHLDQVAVFLRALQLVVGVHDDRAHRAVEAALGLVGVGLGDGLAQVGQLQPARGQRHGVGLHPHGCLLYTSPAAAARRAPARPAGPPAGALRRLARHHPAPPAPDAAGDAGHRGADRPAVPGGAQGLLPGAGRRRAARRDRCV